MSLANYTDLQTAIQTEIDKIETGFVAALPDLVKRCEVKLNRRLRLREMEQLSYTTYSVGTTAIEDRLLAVPSPYVEVLDLRAKVATANDDSYEPVTYVDPAVIHRYYTTSTSGTLYYTLRDQIEFSRPVGVDHEVMMHFIKKWDIAADTTNWLLTNYPDVYLYGSLVEAALFWRDKDLFAIWKAMFDEAMTELNELSERGRDEAELDVNEVSSMSNRGHFNVLTG